MSEPRHEPPPHETARENPWEANDPNNPRHRPQPDPPTRSSRILEGIGWGALALGLVYAALRYPQLPETVPTHFGITGEPDDWGHKTELLTPLAVMTASAVLCLVAARFPRSHNFLRPAPTDEAWQRAYTYSRNICYFCGIGVALIIPGILGLQANPGGLPWDVIIPLVIMILPTTYYFVKLVKLSSAPTIDPRH